MRRGVCGRRVLNGCGCGSTELPLQAQRRATEATRKRPGQSEECRGVDPALRVSACKWIAVLCLLAMAPAGVFAQVDAQLTAKRRIFPEMGPGLKAVKRGADGKTYVLASPSPGLVVYSAEYKKILAMREAGGLPAAALAEARASGEVLVGFGEDCDVDADGNIYIADRANNAVEIFSPTGKHLKSIPVNNPVSVAVLPEGEFAVATLREPVLVRVFDKNGRLTREFGDPEVFTERKDLNRYLNLGQLNTDSLGHLYYSFEFSPEPTVRQYDRFGYAGQEVKYTALDAMPEAQAMRREIEKQEKKGDTPRFKRILTAMGVEKATGEIWIAMGSTLLRFDREGNRRATYLLYTPENARLEVDTILVEKDKFIVGGDPIGIYEFDRIDNK